MNSIYFILELMGATKTSTHFSIYLKKSSFILNIPTGYSDKDIINYLGFQTFNSKSFSKSIRKDIGLLCLTILDIQNKSTLPFI